MSRYPEDIRRFEVIRDKRTFTVERDVLRGIYIPHIEGVSAKTAKAQADAIVGSIVTTRYPVVTGAVATNTAAAVVGGVTSGNSRVISGVVAAATGTGRAGTVTVAKGAVVKGAVARSTARGRPVGASVDALAEATTVYNSAGSFSYTGWPSWVEFFDIVCLGGGASGVTGSGANGQAGKGGSPGIWYARTVAKNDLTGVTSMSVVVGASTGRAGNSDLSPALDGNPSSVTATGLSVIGGGGEGGRPENQQEGKGSGDFTFNGKTYTGSVDSSPNFTGNPPGGGGGGGNGGIFGMRTQGWEGQYGRVWIRAWRRSAI